MILLFVSDDEREAESDVGSSDEAEAESDAGSGDSIDDASVPASPLHAKPSGWTPLYRRCG